MTDTGESDGFDREAPKDDAPLPSTDGWPAQARWWPAFGRGLAVALFTGFVWGLASFMSGVRLAFLPVLSSGFVIGEAVGGAQGRRAWHFGLTGATLALLGSLGAELLALWGVVVLQLGFLPHRFLHPDALRAIFLDQWHFTDFLPYGVAAWEGYYFAMRPAVGPASFWGAPATPKRQRRGLLALGGIVLLFGLFLFNMHRGKIDDLALSPDGQTLAVACSGYDTWMPREVRLWDLPQGQRRLLGLNHADRLAWSPDGRLLAVVANANTNHVPDAGRVAVWDVGRDQSRALLGGHRSFVKCVAFAPDGTGLAAGDQDGSVQVWDARAWGRRATLEHGEAVSCLAFSADGRSLAVGLRDGTLALWDVPTCQRRACLKAHRAAISDLLFAADGQALFSAGGVDATVRTWELAALRPRAVVALQVGWITGLTLSGDGRLLAVACGSFHRSGEVKLLDPTTGWEEGSFTVEANTVRRAVFTRDGRTLIAGTAGPISPWSRPRHGALYRWELPTGRLLEPLP